MKKEYGSVREGMSKGFSCHSLLNVHFGDKYNFFSKIYIYSKTNNIHYQSRRCQKRLKLLHKIFL